jgi:pimeloyl-ACP methyl ester carboxylesterase
MKAIKKLLGWGMVCLSLAIFGCSEDATNSVTSSDGVEIRFDRQGDRSPTLIFVHGWGNDRSVWSAQAVHFSRDYEVIAVDLPGFGDSGNNREQFTIASYGEDIAAVVRDLNLEQVVLIGFSMGASVVIEAANRVPEQVIGVILVDDMHDLEAKIPPEGIGELERAYMELVANPTKEALVGGGFYRNDTEASFQRIVAMLEDAPRAGWRESLLDAFRWQNEDGIESVSRVRAPIVAINSDGRPTDVETFRKYVPSFRAKIVPDTGHLVMWDAPEEFNRLLEETVQELMSE